MEGGSEMKVEKLQEFARREKEDSGKALEVARSRRRMVRFCACGKSPSLKWTDCNNKKY